MELIVKEIWFKGKGRRKEKARSEKKRKGKNEKKRKERESKIKIEEKKQTFFCFWFVFDLVAPPTSFFDFFLFSFPVISSIMFLFLAHLFRNFDTSFESWDSWSILSKNVGTVKNLNVVIWNDEQFTILMETNDGKLYFD